MRLPVVLMIFLAVPSLFADVVDQVSLNTAALIGNSSGPFTLDFQLVEGDGLSDSLNTVALSNFSLGGGTITTPASSTSGGVSVTATPFRLNMDESSFFADAEFLFTPGTMLSFQVDATTNIDTVAPDTFTFAIFDKNLNPVPTTNPNGFNTFLEIDLPTTGSGTQTISSSTDATQTNIRIGAPTVTPQTTVVPEPNSLALVASMIAGMYLQRRKSLKKRKLAIEDTP
jgi:hypothetical protein